MNIVLTQREKKLVISMGIFLVLILIAPAFGLQYAQDYLSQQQSEKRELENEIVELRNRLDGIEEEREAVRANRENYLRWVRRGVVGEQNPVGWVKTMQRLQEERYLFPLKYEFNPEQLLTPDASPFTAGSTVRLRLWEMYINMAMLHDLDMLMFLDALNQEISSLLFPVECDFSLLEDEFSLVDRENMSANCTLVWVSAEDPAIKPDVINSGS